ncbi:uncharacterized protein SOCE26_031680 [Sorangium cellulosum]|uniref:Uncharacterized protein n=1 Tax=Sorangium cellulosum TaxID=56 RepID=A0A2L0ER42_SORCE|nr:hypothetical protein [Sorangium cellulosum]AUX41745.1 uncharacterized protein SOCE26_031680 [Sorangium cellulosum]
MRATYRDDEDVARLHIESLLERHRAQVDALPEHLRRIHGRRVARSLAGAVALAGALVVAAVSAIGVVVNDVMNLLAAHSSGGMVALLAAWAAVAIAYALGPRLARAKLHDALACDVRRSGDVHGDRARLEAAAPEARVRALLDDEEHRSIVLPLAGFVVLAPLSLHLVFHAVRYGATAAMNHPLIAFDRWIAEFDRWIVLSMVLVGHVHAIVAYLSFRYARALHEGTTKTLVAAPPPGGVRALGIAVFASLFPGGLLGLMLPLIVAATGALVLLPAFHLARARLLDERRQLAAD